MRDPLRPFSNSLRFCRAKIKGGKAAPVAIMVGDAAIEGCLRSGKT